MGLRNAVWKCFVHADNNSAYGFVRFVTIEDRIYPSQLSSVKLLLAGIVQIYKIDSVLHPVVIGSKRMIVRIISQSLFTNRLGVQPVGELQDEILAALWRNSFMI